MGRTQIRWRLMKWCFRGSCRLLGKALSLTVDTSRVGVKSYRRSHDGSSLLYLVELRIQVVMMDSRCSIPCLFQVYPNLYSFTTACQVDPSSRPMLPLKTELPSSISIHPVMLPVQNLLEKRLVMDLVPRRILFPRWPYVFFVVFLHLRKAGHVALLLNFVFGCCAGWLVGLRAWALRGGACKGC